MIDFLHTSFLRYQVDQLTVRLGDHHLYKSDDAQPREYQVAIVKQHPLFQRHGFFNDIGLIKLKEPVSYNDYMRPICLPTSQERSR